MHKRVVVEVFFNGKPHIMATRMGSIRCVESVGCVFWWAIIFTVWWYSRLSRTWFWGRFGSFSSLWWLYRFILCPLTLIYLIYFC